jgi:LssY C-terminus
MSKLWILLLIAPSFVCAQSTPKEELTFQVSAAQSWTDTGIDLQSGDVVKITATADAPSGTPACDPKGVAGAASTSDLPLSSAAPGALIAKLQAQAPVPVLVGASNEIRIQQASHLFLAMNAAGSPPCQGSLAVKVEKVAAAASAATATEQKTRGQQLKSQLGNAAQVFMAGQFGTGKTGSTTSNGSNTAVSTGDAAASPAAPALTLSETPIDSDLRKEIDGLPRRVNDQFNNLGDMVNFVIVGSEKDVQSALEAATWHIADTDNRKAVLNAVMQTYGNKDYLAMPMSQLYLFGRKQDYGYEMAEPIAMVASRHHFRIWKAPFNWKGQDVWVGAGTHDIGFAKDQRNNSVTHKIDPSVDGERDNIGASLQKANKAKRMVYYLPPNPVQEAKNATGDGYHSDGRLLVVFLQ